MPQRVELAPIQPLPLLPVRSPRHNVKHLNHFLLLINFIEHNISANWEKAGLVFIEAAALWDYGQHVIGLAFELFDKTDARFGLSCAI